MPVNVRSRRRGEGELEQLRTARLLFDRELEAGTVSEQDLAAPEVSAATRVARVPSPPRRILQRVRYKLGRLDFERDVLEPLASARRAVLGEHAAAYEARPRFLVRVDEFPHYLAWDDPARFGTERFVRFHEILEAAGVPYLIAVLPRVSRAPLSPTGMDSRPLADEEVATLRRLAGDRVTFGLHGLTHRTRFASPRRHSELCGLDAAETEALLDAGLAELAEWGIAPDVFVPPYNRFDAAQLELLARRFAVVCGGPESIGTVGFQRSPQWRGDSVYLPSYLPFYGHAAEILPAVQRAIAAAVGGWIPIVLHWGWEADAGWRDLERLVRAIATYTDPWEDLLTAVARSRDGLRLDEAGSELRRIPSAPPSAPSTRPQPSR
jgi:hypothetical protein